MSEDFDREAEKERLREKFEAEEESRQSTEHMSELLLKGATMTNRHCDTCGDPIFRYDGQAFCPTCEEAVDENGASAGGDDQESETAEGADASAETDTAVRSEAPAEAGADATGGAAASPEADAGADDPGRAEHSGGRGSASEPDPPAETAGAPATEGRRGTDEGRGSPSRDETRQPGTATPARQSATAASTRQPRGAGATGTVGDARASLVRTLSDLAARAEAAEDVRHTRDLLGAAREAAEAIAALDRADR